MTFETIDQNSRTLTEDPFPFGLGRYIDRYRKDTINKRKRTFSCRLGEYCLGGLIYDYLALSRRVYSVLRGIDGNEGISFGVRFRARGTSCNPLTSLPTNHELNTLTTHIKFLHFVIRSRKCWRGGWCDLSKIPKRSTLHVCF